MKTGLELERRRHSPLAPWTYEALDRRQREIALRAAQGGAGGILLSEVAPVITLGRRTPATDFQETLARSRGIGLFRADRGGLATYHGPGQWVLFVVDRLERLTGDPRGVRKMVCALLDVAREVAREYVPDAEIRDGSELGVWGPRGKLAAVGIHVKDGVVLHGLCVNGFRTEQSFVGLRPCGLDAPVGFFLDDSGDAAFEDLGSQLAAMASDKFNAVIADS